MRVAIAAIVSVLLILVVCDGTPGDISSRFRNTFFKGVLARYHLDSWPVSRLAADSGNASNA